jgi:hypothetical protein
MGPVTVLTFNEIEEALALKQRLEQAGICAEIQDDHEVQKLWFMSHPLASVHLNVPEAEQERVIHLLKEWDAREGVLQDAIHCPECGSPRIQFPQFTRRIASAWLGGLLCALGLMQRQFYCKDCHYTWPVAVKLRKRTDLLGWPKKQARSSRS